MQVLEHLEYSAVHPHVCGEYYLIQNGESMMTGSPPRVWGILNFPQQAL